MAASLFPDSIMLMASSLESPAWALIRLNSRKKKALCIKLPFVLLRPAPGRDHEKTRTPIVRVSIENALIWVPWQDLFPRQAEHSLLRSHAIKTVLGGARIDKCRPGL